MLCLLKRWNAKLSLSKLTFKTLMRNFISVQTRPTHSCLRMRLFLLFVGVFCMFVVFVVVLFYYFAVNRNKSVSLQLLNRKEITFHHIHLLFLNLCILLKMHKVAFNFVYVVEKKNKINHKKLHPLNQYTRD